MTNTDAGPRVERIVAIHYDSLLRDADSTANVVTENSTLERQIEQVRNTASFWHAWLCLSAQRRLMLQAYGPDGLGLLTVAGVPGFVELRQRLLPLAQAFAVCGPPGFLQHCHQNKGFLHSHAIPQCIFTAPSPCFVNFTVLLAC